MTINDSDNTSITDNWWLNCVYNDSEFKEDIENLVILENYTEDLDKIKTVKSNVSAKYKISENDINLFILNKTLFVRNDKKGAKLSFNPKSQTFSIEFTIDANRAEVIEEWKKSREIVKILNKNSVKRRRPPDNPDLIYAYHKAEITGKSNNEIFNLYSEMQLPGYTKKPIAFDTPKELRDYFIKRKP
jgi:hypothetical protein